MAGAASQAGDTDPSRAPGLTSGLQGSLNVYRGVSIVGVTVTVHQFFCILHYHEFMYLYCDVTFRKYTSYNLGRTPPFLAS